MSKQDNSLLWVVGGLAAAFGVYELFIKPKAPVAAVVPSTTSNTGTNTQVQLPAAAASTNPLNNLVSSITKLLAPASTPAASTNNATIAPSNFYVDTPVQTNPAVNQSTPIYTPVPVTDVTQQTDQEAYDSQMYADYEASLAGVHKNFEV